MKNHEIEVFLTEGKVKINETVEALENCCTAMEAPPGMQRAKRVIRERALSSRTRVSFRVLLSRDFSRLSQMESLLVGYPAKRIGCGRLRMAIKDYLGIFFVGGGGGEAEGESGDL